MASAEDKKSNEDDIKFKSWMKSIKTALRAVDNAYVQACSISIVPDQLKKSNEDAYMPNVVTMGPLYKGTSRDLLHMEEIKLRCMLSLFHRSQKDVHESLEECSKAILDLDKLVRASYVDDIKLDAYELARTMLYDGCFLLELLINGSEELNNKLGSRLVPPGPGAQVVKEEDVLCDLTMLENQIPVLILHTLSQILFRDDFTSNVVQRITKINDLALSLLGYSPVSSPDAPHFLELVHSSIPGKSQRVEDRGNLPGKSEKVVEIVKKIQHYSSIVVIKNHEELKLKRCATRLQAAGVTVKVKLPNIEPWNLDMPLNGDSKLVQRLFSVKGKSFVSMLMRLVKRSGERKHVNNNKPEVMMTVSTSFDFDIRFSQEDGILEIPQLHITKTTKAKWRNFIAWEHHKKNWKSSSIAAAGVDQSPTGLSCKCTSSALIFNGLICCPSDVQLLKDRNIIVDHLKMSNEELKTFFRTISMGVDHSIVDSSYIEMCHDLNTYSAANCFKKFCITAWHYCICYLEWLIEFLKRDYNFAAAAILILTVVQTLYAVLSYHTHK